MDWKKQGSVVTSEVPLADGRMATIAIVGPRSNVKGAVLIVPKEDGDDVDKLPLAQGLVLLGSREAIDILGMQERLHGESGLNRPAELT